MFEDKNFQAKVDAFAALLHEQQLAELSKKKLTFNGWEKHADVGVHYAKKYVRVDVGNSGKYLVDVDGNIWGIKSYGVIHRGHQYGTLDTIHEWDWSYYQAKRLS